MTGLAAFRRPLFVLLAASCLTTRLAWAAPPHDALGEAVSFHIAAGPLGDALLALADQAHLQLAYDPADVAGRTAPGLSASLSPRAALVRLLRDQDITISESRAGVIVLKRRPHVQPPAAANPPASEAPVALDRQAGPRAAPLQSQGTAQADLATEVAEVVVTGSLIRGAGLSASPRTTYSRDQIDRAGRATLADFLADLPQNFGGAATPSTALLGSDGRSTNDTMAKGVNLRGLGAQSTLVLVNGQRMAGAGLKGDFADVSAIPTAVIDHVDVLLDGASALYGSDAVGGVVNVVLKSDFSGQESRLRFGQAEGGVAGQIQASHLAGSAWTGGHVLLSYEYEHDDDLAAAARRTTANADLRSLGGTDHRLIYSHPGNILAYSPAAGGYVAAYAIPTGQDGAHLAPSDFIPGAANLQNYRIGADVQPEQDRHSLFLDLKQDLSRDVSVSMSARYSQRSFLYKLPASTTIFNVTQANPFFVSPNGTRSELVGYSFADELGPTRSTGVSGSLGLTLGLDWKLPRDWRAEIYGALASEKGRRRTVNEVNGGYLNEALGNTPDDPTTAYSAARDGYFNPFGDGGANSAKVLAFIGQGSERSSSASQALSLNAKADGTLMSFPGGGLKAAIGFQLRQEQFKPSATVYQSGATPQTSGGVSYERNISAAFVELRAPLVGEGGARPGVERLELSLAGRVEHYDDVGETANPKLGVIWVPTPGLNVRASYGTSFRAPSLTEVYGLSAIAPTFLANGPSRTLVLLEYGGNRSLRPETARSWTYGFDYAPPSWPGLTFSVTGFDIDYRNQIGKPVLENLAQALNDPAYAPFVRRIAPGSSAADLALISDLVAHATSSSARLFPPTAYGAIVDARVVNAAEIAERGFDISAAYRFQKGADHFELSTAATYLDAFSRKLTPSAASRNLVSLAGEPVDLRARVSFDWSRGDFAASSTLYYTDRYRSETGARIDAWWTSDIQLRWTPSAAAGPFAGLALALSAQNLFDSTPPFYDSPQAVGYDPANANPLGRVVSVQMTKRW